METTSIIEESSLKEAGVQKPAISRAQLGIEIGLLTGCQDRPYAFGLAMALVSKGVAVDIIGGDEIDSPELYNTRELALCQLSREPTKSRQRCEEVMEAPGLLCKADPDCTFEAKGVGYFVEQQDLGLDRTILMLYYKAVGKKIAFTAHNVNQARRDAKDSWLNRTTLRIQYQLCDHIFVHTQKMKDELRQDFDVAEKVVTVIRHPVNDAFPDTGAYAG